MGSIEQASNHPIGHSILKICRERKISFFDTKNVLISNNGIEGYIIDENVNLMKKVYGGNQEFIRQKGFLILSDEQKRIKREEKEGHTVLFFAVEGDKYAGFFSFGDTLKDDAMQIIKYFQANKISIILLSGDSLATTRAIARQIGIENFIAEAKSENKISKIIDLQKAGKVVAMVGDGINDTPALAQADIGITVRNGIELAHESSAITLQRDDLNLINNLLSLSGRTMRTIHQNLTWAFLYNAIGIALAVGGILNPLISAAAMLASSLSVIGNSLRISWSRAKENYGNPDFSKAL
jgi:Cu+-exporting ATPase